MNDDKADKLIEALTLLRDAIMYHASVVGYKADDLNVGPDGKAVVSLQLTIPPDSMPAAVEIKPVEPEVLYSFDDVRAALNKLAKKQGKAKTLELVKKYSPSGDIKEISVDHYGRLIKEAE